MTRKQQFERLKFERLAPWQQNLLTGLCERDILQRVHNREEEKPRRLYEVQKEHPRLVKKGRKC